MAVGRSALLLAAPVLLPVLWACGAVAASGGGAGVPPGTPQECIDELNEHGSNGGAYCDVNATPPSIDSCERGHYCPDVLTQLPCPAKRFCYEGLDAPRSCYLAVSCSQLGEGSANPNMLFGIGLHLLMYLLIAGAGALILRALDSRYRQARREFYLNGKGAMLAEVKRQVVAYATLWRIKTSYKSRETQIHDLVSYLMSNLTQRTITGPGGLEYRHVVRGGDIVASMANCPIGAWRGRHDWLLEHGIIKQQAPVAKKGTRLGHTLRKTLPTSEVVDSKLYYSLNPVFDEYSDNPGLVHAFLDAAYRAKALVQSDFREKLQLLASGRLSGKDALAGVTAIPREERFPLFFSKITVHYGNPKRPALQNISGFFEPGKLTAILGPSGAGKTTFLNMLHGTLSSKAHVQGDILVGAGHVDSLQAYRSSISYMPQEPVLFENLTAAENIWMAILTLHARPDSFDVAARTAELLRILELQEVADTVIGRHSNISGGQRKRLSMALALATEPKLLLLDEPTSGLDASSGITIMAVVKKLSKLGVNVVCTIHQPRSKVFRMFDNLIVFVKGGREVYNGPRSQVVHYLEQAGFSKRARTNPADFVFDVMSGLVQRRGQVRMPTEKSAMAYLHDTWARQQRSISRHYFASFAEIDFTPEAVQPPVVRTVVRQLKWAIVRNLLVELRTVKALFLEGLALSFFGGLMILLLTGFEEKLVRVADAVVLLVMLVGIVRTAGALHAEQDMRKLTMRGGLSGTSYLLGFVLGRPLSLLLPALSVAGAVTAAGNPFEPGFIFAAVMAGFFCARGFGCLVGVVIESWLWQTASLLIGLIIWFFRGISPLLEDLETDFPFIGRFLYDISPGNYLAHAVVNSEMSGRPGYTRETSAQADTPKEWNDLDNVGRQVGPLVAIGVAIYALALFYLVVSKNNFSVVYRLYHAACCCFSHRATQDNLRNSFFEAWSDLAVDAAVRENDRELAPSPTPTAQSNASPAAGPASSRSRFGQLRSTAKMQGGELEPAASPVAVPP